MNIVAQNKLFSRKVCIYIFCRTIRIKLYACAEYIIKIGIYWFSTTNVTKTCSLLWVIKVGILPVNQSLYLHTLIYKFATVKLRFTTWNNLAKEFGHWFKPTCIITGFLVRDLAQHVSLFLINLLMWVFIIYVKEIYYFRNFNSFQNQKWFKQFLQMPIFYTK